MMCPYCSNVLLLLKNVLGRLESLHFHLEFQDHLIKFFEELYWDFFQVLYLCGFFLSPRLINIYWGKAGGARSRR